jgi:hypothetical protein
VQEACLHGRVWIAARDAQQVDHMFEYDLWSSQGARRSQASQSSAALVILGSPARWPLTGGHANAERPAQLAAVTSRSDAVHAVVPRSGRDRSMSRSGSWATIGLGAS